MIDVLPKVYLFSQLLMLYSFFFSFNFCYPYSFHHGNSQRGNMRDKWQMKKHNSSRVSKRLLQHNPPLYMN
uniref:Uncharacterized protein LOC107646021 isoform X3 n=1 Tax=Rhizophora mucronata TaxID=61149 RepID=A0A2P2KT06_RHIMU